MTDELLAYLLDDLPPRKREEVELRIQSDAQWRREYERLRDCFEASQEDANDAGGQCVDGPPADLVSRTCNLVDSGEFTLLRQLEASESGRASAVYPDAAEESSPRACRWSLADVVIAAGVMLVLVGVFSPALLRSREYAREHLCKNNLRRVGTKVYDFAARGSGMLPLVPADQLMGNYVQMLCDGLGIQAKTVGLSFTCPNSNLAEDLANGKTVFLIPTQAEIRDMDGETRKYALERLGHVFAFQTGRRDKGGSMRPAPLNYSTSQPIAAHPPVLTPDGPVIANQGQCSPNMVWGDMSVRPYEPIPSCEDRDYDDPFVNENDEHAAPNCENESALLRGDVTPSGQTGDAIDFAPARRANPALLFRIRSNR